MAKTVSVFAVVVLALLLCGEVAAEVERSIRRAGGSFA
jgi:hypothetical protein